MSKKFKIIIGVILSVVLIAITVNYLRTVNIEVFNPKGTIAEKQRNLIVFATALSVLVIVPVFTLLFTFLHKYRETNINAKYTPDWDHNTSYEFIWWGIPIFIILILSVVTWNTTHSLDPSKQLESNQKPLQIQVVAMQWKWLFIYQEQNIATVNYLQVPTGRPITFTITADAPMNSFWIPQLGGQIYAMSGMSTKLNLVADQPGSYNGVSANISGEGFAGMRFKAIATSQTDFANWVKQSQQNQNELSYKAYETLAIPSQNNPTATYSPVQKGLYDTIMNMYMLPTAGMDNLGTTDNNRMKHN